MRMDVADVSCRGGGLCVGPAFLARIRNPDLTVLTAVYRNFSSHFIRALDQNIAALITARKDCHKSDGA